MGISKESAYSKEELLSYEEYWRAVSSERTLIEDALTKGKKIGLAEGEEIGLEKGITQIALNMLRQGYPYHEITKLTGLSEDMLKKLQEKNIDSM